MDKVSIFGAVILFGFSLATDLRAQATVSSPSPDGQATGGIDFAHAKPMPLPSVSGPPVSQHEIDRGANQKRLSSPGVVQGSDSGDGQMNPVQLAPALNFPR